jgi:hypothetical protein
MLPSVLALAAGFVTLIAPDVIGVESLNGFLLLTLGVSTVVCLVMARVWPTLWWLWPVFFALGYPASVFYEIALDPRSHNLWPVELVLCLPYAISGLLGAALGRFFLNKSLKGDGMT